MRRSLTARLAPFAVLPVLLVACGDDAADTPEATETTAAAESAEQNCPTITEGVLTIATGEPAFPPYVVDNDPTNKQGFEAAVAYAVAAELGYTDDKVTWVRTTFDEAIQPGPKTFDFNLQQYSITEERKANITFSAPYYTSNQAIVALAGSAAEGATSIADLADVKFGVQAGTTSLQFVNDVITPNEEPFIYDDNVGAKAALEANQIDAIVLDLPTAFYVSAVEIEGSSVIGQFPASAGGTTDEFGLVFEKDSPLAGCVDAAIAALTESGELAAITEQWMSAETGAPIIPVD
jgi:polar amino acid transport system substrate-binding protein